jgi:Transglycosylase SLT domain
MGCEDAPYTSSVKTFVATLVSPTLVLAAGASRVPAPPKGSAYVYTYTDRLGHLIINNLPPSSVAGQGLSLKQVGVGQIRLAITKQEMGRVLRSPELIGMVDEIAGQHGVDPFLARAIIQAESAFNYSARSRAGALGLMQLMPATALRFGVLDPFDTRQNISGGCKYLKWLSDYYKGDPMKVIAAYNAGEGAVDRHKGIPPFRETRAYVPKVMELWTKKLVQPDPKAAGSMELLKKGHGGFEVDERPLPPAQLAQAQERAPTVLYQWKDDAGRLQISDTPPPKGTPGVRTFGSS